MMKFFRYNSETRNQVPRRELDIGHKGKIIEGKFVDEDSPTFLQRMNAHLAATLGNRYVPWGEPEPMVEEVGL